jgi:CubicO group peptidase (beta-lactamase class C family)
MVEPGLPGALVADPWVCTTGWSCVEQASQHGGFGLLDPTPTSGHFVRMSLAENARQSAVLEWTDHQGHTVRLGTYTTMNPQLGTVVAVRGTQAHLVLAKGAGLSTLIWNELGRWQVLFFFDGQNEQQVLALATALQTAH